jgi:hypothetical protein
LKNNGAYSMTTPQIILLAINVIGGAAVIGSYYFGFNTQPNDTSALWGGVPAGVRPVYGISMVLAAFGYFAFLYFVLRLNPAQVKIAGTIDYRLFYAVFLIILIPSAIWMPLTNMYIASPVSSAWIGIRTVLILVGLGSIALLGALLSLEPRVSGWTYWLAIAGSGYFAFHTAVLDAIIWPALFK